MSVYFEHTTSEHVGYIGSVLFEFTGSVHCDHIVWEIVKIFLNDLLQNIVRTLFGNFLNIPNNFPTGKLKSHSLVHCKSPEHVLHWGNGGEIGSEYSEYTYNMLARYVPSLLSQNSQCTRHVTAQYITPCPQ